MGKPLGLVGTSVDASWLRCESMDHTGDAAPDCDNIESPWQ